MTPEGLTRRCTSGSFPPSLINFGVRAAQWAYAGSMNVLPRRAARIDVDLATIGEKGLSRHECGWVWG